jgi:hypothetical protein
MLLTQPQTPAATGSTSGNGSTGSGSGTYKFLELDPYCILDDHYQVREQWDQTQAQAQVQEMQMLPDPDASTLAASAFGSSSSSGWARAGQASVSEIDLELDWSGSSSGVGNGQGSSSSSFEELVQSIRALGVRQPIEVEEIAPEKYKVVTGHRRLAAARVLKLPTIPCIVRLPGAGADAGANSGLGNSVVSSQTLTQPQIQASLVYERVLIQLAENQVRADMDVLDRAIALKMAKVLADIKKALGYLELVAATATATITNANAVIPVAPSEDEIGGLPSNRHRLARYEQYLAELKALLVSDEVAEVLATIQSQVVYRVSVPSGRDAARRATSTATDTGIKGKYSYKLTDQAVNAWSVIEKASGVSKASRVALLHLLQIEPDIVQALRDFLSGRWLKSYLQPYLHHYFLTQTETGASAEASNSSLSLSVKLPAQAASTLTKAHLQAVLMINGSYRREMVLAYLDWLKETVSQALPIGASPVARPLQIKIQHWFDTREVEKLAKALDASLPSPASDQSFFRSLVISTLLAPSSSSASSFDQSTTQEAEPELDFESADADDQIEAEGVEEESTLELENSGSLAPQFTNGTGDGASNNYNNSSTFGSSGGSSGGSSNGFAKTRKRTGSRSDAEDDDDADDDDDFYGYDGTSSGGGGGGGGRQFGGYDGYDGDTDFESPATPEAAFEQLPATAKQTLEEMVASGRVNDTMLTRLARLNVTDRTRLVEIIALHPEFTARTIYRFISQLNKDVLFEEALAEALGEGGIETEVANFLAQQEAERSDDEKLSTATSQMVESITGVTDILDYLRRFTPDNNGQVAQLPAPHGAYLAQILTLLKQALEDAGI